MWLAYDPERERERSERNRRTTNAPCLASVTCLFQTRFWILHGIATKGLIPILINLITVKGA